MKNCIKYFSVFILGILPFLELKAQDLANIEVRLVSAANLGNNAVQCREGGGNPFERRWDIVVGYDNSNFTSNYHHQLNILGCVPEIPPGGSVLVGSFSGVCADEVNFDIDFWEEDLCGSDTTYDTGCTNDDDDFGNVTPSFDFNAMAPGTYQVTVTDPSGDWELIFEVMWSAPVFFLTPPGPIYTNVTHYALTATPGNGTWSIDNFANIDPVTGVFNPSMMGTGGTYTVTYSLCNTSMSRSFSLLNPPSCTIPSDVVCSGATANTIDVSWDPQGLNPSLGHIVEYRKLPAPYQTAVTTDPWINEIITTSTTGDDGFEIVAPVGMDLSCYKAQVYTSGGAVSLGEIDFNTVVPSPGLDELFGAIWTDRTLSVNSAIALVYDASDCNCPGTTRVAHFVSFGAITGGAPLFVTPTVGLAAGATSEHIGAFSGGSGSNSLQLIDINGASGADYSDFQWIGPTASSSGLVNVGQRIVSKVLSGNSTETVTVLNLDPCSEYFFRIRAVCINGSLSQFLGTPIIKCNSITTDPITAGNLTSISPSYEICQGSSPNINLNFSPTDSGLGCLNSSYFIANNAGTIVDGPIANTSLDYSSLADGSYSIYGVAYYGNLINTNVNSLESDEDCLSLAGNSISIEVYDAPTLSNLTGTNPTTCGGTGSVQLNATGSANAGGFEALISPDPNGEGWTTTTSFNNLPVGTYTVIVRNFGDATFLCPPTAALNVTLSNPPNPVINSISETDALCNGEDGTISISNSAGSFTYLWTNGVTNTTTTSPTFNTGAGTYNVTITNNTTQCSTNNASPIMISEPPVLTASIQAATQVSCPNSLDASATVLTGGGTPGYSFLWDNGEQAATATQLGFGPHSVVVTDSQGCTTTATVSITSPSTLVVSSITPNQPVSCNGGNDGSATITAAGGSAGYSFMWDNNEATSTAIQLDAGNHFFTITDANGCGVTGSVMISEPALLTESTTQSEVVCFGEANGSATITAAGGNTGYSYLWGDGSSNPTNATLAAGMHPFTVTDSKGCSVVGSVTITQPTDLTATATMNSNVLCNGENNGSATVAVGGGTVGYTYLWDNGETTAQAVALDADVHTVVVTDSNGCTEMSSVTITEPNVLTATSNSTAGVSCAGLNDGAATITPQGGTTPHTVLWDDNSTDFVNTSLTGGVHTATVTDANGCEFLVAGILIMSPPAINAVASPVSNATCFGFNDGAAMVSITGGSGGNAIQWDANAGSQTNTTATDLAAGTYSVIVTDINNCTVTVSTMITEPDEVVPALDAPPTISCINTEQTLTATATGGSNTGFTYTWNTNETTSTISLPITGITNNYTISAEDSNGCEGTTSGIIEGVDGPDLSAIESVTINESDGLTINLDQFSTDPDNVSYNWDRNYVSGNCSTDDNSSDNTDDVLTNTFTVSNPNTTGQATYEVTPYILLNGEECEGTSTTFEVIVLPNGESATFFVPDVFIKSLDSGRWDIKVTDSDTSAEAFTLQVFNRSGAKVHEGNLGTSWDGADVQDGVYYYVIKDGNSELKTGAVLVQQ